MGLETRKDREAGSSRLEATKEGSQEARSSKLKAKKGEGKRTKGESDACHFIYS
jgi:hypothetical protein